MKNECSENMEKKTYESKSEMNRSRKVDKNYHRIKLVSFGDRIPNGTYTIHSRFQRTINFHNNALLISIVNEDIGCGPFNIIVKGLDLKKIHSLSIYNNILTINNIALFMQEALKYSSKLSLNGVIIATFEENLVFLETVLTELCAEKSLCFLLDEERERNFTSGFEKEFIKRMKSGVALILKGTMDSLFEGVSKIKGCGFGLTPSGDDFIAGLLSGLYLKQELFGTDLSEVRNRIYENALGDNLISNTFLFLAKEGLFVERFKNFTHSLLYDEKEKIYTHIQKVLNIGETSGADMLVGFMFSFKKAGELW